MTDGEVTLRPLRESDIPAGQVLMVEALDSVTISLDATPHLMPPGSYPSDRGADRIRHVILTDPGGAWVAERADEALGMSLAIRRGPLWHLSLLVVSPASHGEGIGHRLLDAALQTAHGASGATLLATRDPRALRRYHAAGFALHPAYSAEGQLDRSLIPTDPGVRDGDIARDSELVDAIVTRLRGAPSSRDLAWNIRWGAQLHIVEDGHLAGFAVSGDGKVFAAGADTPELATRVSWAGLATAGEADAASLSYLTGSQQWAIDLAMAARLPLRLSGSVALRGDVGPFTPYLPSGIWG